MTGRILALTAAALLGGCGDITTGSHGADGIALTAAGGAMKTHLVGGDPAVAAAIAVIDGLVLLAKEARKDQSEAEKAGADDDTVAAQEGADDTAGG